MWSAYNYELHLKLVQVSCNVEPRQRTRDVLIELAAACYVATLTNIDIIEGLKDTTSTITTAAVANTATFGIEHAARIVGNTAASTAVSAIVDVAVSSALLYVAKRKRDEGVITNKEFTTQVKKTMFRSGIKIAAGATGSIIGQAVIPVPVLGGLVGGFCGSLIGTGIAKGLNYGIFDRIEKREKLKLQQEQEGDMQQKACLYTPRFHGHVASITIYNDTTKQFEEKRFASTRKGEGGGGGSFKLNRSSSHERQSHDSTSDHQQKESTDHRKKLSEQIEKRKTSIINYCQEIKEKLCEDEKGNSISLSDQLQTRKKSVVEYCRQSLNKKSNENDVSECVEGAGDEKDEKLKKGNIYPVDVGISSTSDHFRPSSGCKIYNDIEEYRREKDSEKSSSFSMNTTSSLHSNKAAQENVKEKKLKSFLDRWRAAASSFGKTK